MSWSSNRNITTCSTVGHSKELRGAVFLSRADRAGPQLPFPEESFRSQPVRGEGKGSKSGGHSGSPGTVLEGGTGRREGRREGRGGGSRAPGAGEPGPGSLSRRPGRERGKRPRWAALGPGEAGQGRGLQRAALAARSERGGGREDSPRTGAGGATAAPTGGCRLQTAAARLE